MSLLNSINEVLAVAVLLLPLALIDGFRLFPAIPRSTIVSVWCPVSWSRCSSNDVLNALVRFEQVLPYRVLRYTRTHALSSLIRLLSPYFEQSSWLGTAVKRIKSSAWYSCTAAAVSLRAWVRHSILSVPPFASRAPSLRQITLFTLSFDNVFETGSRLITKVLFRTSRNLFGSVACRINSLFVDLATDWSSLSASTTIAGQMTKTSSPAMNVGCCRTDLS